jgi:DNA modification methylase
VKACTESEAVLDYLGGSLRRPLFLCGDALAVLGELPDGCVDCCMTSPPYWGQRQYAQAGIGLEPDYHGYVAALCSILREVRRVLKPTGSLWLNIGDTYSQKQLLGIPWRVALELTDRQRWVLRNSVIWHKVKGGPDNAVDKLRNVHEHVFHFVKASQYYYDIDAVRARPSSSRVVNGAVVSATGVSGVRYRRQIELSTALSNQEKGEAMKALDRVLGEVREGKISDFRMIIRGHQRTTHSDSTRVSGRAKELGERGFYLLKYHPNGAKPKDVWDILPEDTQGRTSHFAPYPADLCRIPILATCPPEGIVLDPFCGTGTTMLVAFQLGRRSIGIDICSEYLGLAKERCQLLL